MGYRRHQVLHRMPRHRMHRNSLPFAHPISCPPCPSPFPGRPRQLRALLKANPRALFYADSRYVALRAFCTDATHGLALSPDEFCHVTCTFPRTPQCLPSPAPISLASSLGTLHHLPCGLSTLSFLPAVLGRPHHHAAVHLPAAQSGPPARPRPLGAALRGPAQDRPRAPLGAHHARRHVAGPVALAHGRRRADGGTRTCTDIIARLATIAMPSLSPIHRPTATPPLPQLSPDVVLLCMW
jgi:hypothetical protein